MRHPEPCLGQLPNELLTPELRRDLGVQLLAALEDDVEAERCDPDFLLPGGLKAHLDPFVLGIPNGDVLEGAKVDIGLELAVENRQDVPVEGSRYACRVVVGG